MLVSRWLRTLTRIVLGATLGAPVVAIPLAVLCDRGPAGKARISPHFFSLVLWLFDDFAWTCARNSVTFASVVSLLSLVAGGALGWLIGSRRFWGRGAVFGMASALLAVAPAFLALGLQGIFGSPRPWPWPLSVTEGGAPGVSLESWRGLPLWLVWVWTTAPWGVALVALVTATKVGQLEPSWSDAARLTGAGSFRAWRALLWPLVRPSSARAAALVFVFALAEPGAPLVLGLRRTLAFQIVVAVGRVDPFPGVAVWGFMTGVLALAGWLAWRWAGGTSILESRGDDLARARSKPAPGRPGRVPGLALTLLAAAWAAVGWLPALGLVRLMIGGGRAVPLSTGGALAAIADHARQASQPPVTQVLVNSLSLALEVALVTMAVAWLVGPGTRTHRNHQHAGARALRVATAAPPLLQGVGVLALAWLAALGHATLVDRGGWPRLAAGLGTFSAWLDPWRNSWTIMSCCVLLALLPRFLSFWRTEIVPDRLARSARSARDAALLAGASRARSARLGQPRAHGRWLAAGLLVGALAATNLTPALLVEPWSDGQTLAPAIVRMAAGPADARSQAAALAFGAIAINMLALAVARASSALPAAIEPE